MAMTLFNRSFSCGLLCAASILLIPPAASAQRVIDFEDLSLAEDSYYNGSDGAGGFSSGGALFNNYFEDNEWGGFWGGWSYSNIDDPVTPGWGNQYAAIAGTGLGPTGVYAVAYMDTFTPTIPRIVLPEETSISGIHVTNTTYAYNIILNGDDGTEKFGGEDGAVPDYFILTITGLAADDSVTGSIDFYLADYRFEDNDLNYIVDAWTRVDLSVLGSDTRAIEFSMDSSDRGIFGMNTPAYFALGAIEVIETSAPAAALRVELLPPNGEGLFRMAVKGEPLQNFVIEASSDLKNWEPLEVVSTNVDGAYEFTDVDSSNHAMRFYRARPE